MKPAACLVVVALLCLWPCLPALAGGLTLPVPQGIADGATVGLRCGVTYQGTLDLRGKTGVTVTTVGKCARARLSPGRAINGWRRHRGKVYSAPVPFVPAQLVLEGYMQSLAHWPHRGWATSVAGMPHRSLAGASMVVQVNRSVIQSFPFSAERVGAGQPFYLEGKLWMLDRPGEWALDKGRLYLWPPDGRSPEGRTWAAPDRDGIDAAGSHGVVIDGIAIFSARDGINGGDSTGLSIRNTEIKNSHRDGIWAGGSNRLTVRGSRLDNARRTGINGWYWINGARISDSIVSNSGMAGMPGPSDAGILFGGGADNHIDRVRVSNSAYHGINMLASRRSSVKHSMVDHACVRLADCGAIYASARERQPLALLIEGNAIRHASGLDASGVYLDDHANSVTVRDNTLAHNRRGLVMHNGFDNQVSGNRFAASLVAHVSLAQDIGRMRHNRIAGNTFHAGEFEQVFNLEAGADYRQFAKVDGNRYVVGSTGILGHVWDGSTAAMALDYQTWRERMGQDLHSARADTRERRRTQQDAQGRGAAP